MKRKLIFLDIDGTLVTDDKQIPEENSRVLKKVREQGHIVVLASGRMINSVKAQARKLGFTDEGCYVIGFNGAMAVNMHTDEVVYRRPVSRQHIRKLFDMAYQFGLHAQGYTDGAVITEKDDEEVRYYSSVLHCPYEVVEDASEYLTEDSGKCLFIDLHDRNKLESFRQAITPYCEANGLTIFFSEDKYLDVVCEGVSKAAGITYMCEHFGIPMEDTIAVGDAENDISMIETAAIGCAVSNAPDHVKAHADYVTEADNNHAAVAEVIKKFILRE